MLEWEVTAFLSGMAVTSVYIDTFFVVKSRYTNSGK